MNVLRRSVAAGAACLATLVLAPADSKADPGDYGNSWLQASCVNKVTGTFCIGYTIGHCADERPYGDPCSSDGAGGPTPGPRQCSQSEDSTTYQCLHKWCAYGCVPGNSPPGYHDDNWVPTYTCGNTAACGPDYNGCAQGCNTPDPTCKCGSGKVCNTATGTCDPSQNCANGTPTYPPKNNPPPVEVGLGYDLPDPAASWACTQLSAIPYAGQVLFTPGGGIGAHGYFQEQSTDEWAATCRHETSDTTAAGVTVNICGLGIDGAWEGSDSTEQQYCVDCNPTPPVCGSDLACTTKTSKSKKQVTITKTFALTSQSVSCTAGDAGGGKKWLNWLKKNINVSVNVGGGWNGTDKKTETTRGPAVACDSACQNCKTDTDENSIFLQLGGNATLSPPSWKGVSAACYVSLAGRVSVGLFNVKSCAYNCSGTKASASVTLRLGASVGAFGLSASAAVGCTCSWSKSWSDCPKGATNVDEPSGCRWSSSLDAR